MDFGSETMNKDLVCCLKSAGVKDEVLTVLEEDELNTVEVLDSTSDSLLKQCGVKAGQIIRLRSGLQMFKEKQQMTEPDGGSSLLSSPTHIPSSPLSFSSSPVFPLLPESVSMPSSPYSVSSNITLSDEEKENSETNIVTFADSKVLKCDGKWLQEFELPTRFSTCVSKALAAKKMTSSERNDFTRDICTSMMARTLYPTKQERDHVAFMIVKRYPFLADKLGTGIGSWEQAIKNRFKNKRKNKPQPGLKRSILKVKPTGSLPVKPKKVKLMDVGGIPEIPDGETKETCKEHATAMKKEMSKSTNRNINMIKQLMGITFPLRRQMIVNELMSIENTVKEYPGLRLLSEFKAEFGRILNDKTLSKSMVDNFKGVLKPKILKLAKSKPLGNNLLEEMQESIADNVDQKSEIEDTVAIMLLPHLVNKKGTGELLKICSDDDSIDLLIEDAIAPKLVGGGHVGEVSPLYLVAEGKVVLKLNSTVPICQALVLLVASFYVFNIEYPSNMKSVYLSLEATLMERLGDAKKRVSVNKFLQELN